MTLSRAEIARAVRALACALLLVTATPVAASQSRTRLTVYTALEPEQQRAVKAAIEDAVPDVEVSWVWAATGVITDRILAERDHPGADMILGLAATSLIALKAEGLLAPYRPSDSDQLRAQFVDGREPYSWTGMDAYLGVLCFNGDRAARARISVPVSWRDLLSPTLRGRVVMPDPRRSGTGYLFVASWLQSMGEAGGWAFMDALDANISAYLPSGAAPCRAAARAGGGDVVGLSFDLSGASLAATGAPIKVVVPIDGVGWEEEGFAIVKGSPQQALAEAVADWAASRSANQVYAGFTAVVAHPSVPSAAPHYPAYAEARMIRSDMAWAAENRSRILAEWARRYASKASPSAGPSRAKDE